MLTTLDEQEFINYIAELSNDQLVRMYDNENEEMSDTELFAMGAELQRRGLDNNPWREANEDYQREELSRL